MAFKNEQKHERRGGGTMVLVNKNYAAHDIYLDTANMETSADNDDNCDLEIEMTLVKMRPARLPQGILDALCRVRLHRAKSQNAIKNDNQRRRNANPTRNRHKSYATKTVDLRLWGLQHGEVYTSRPVA
jgi:hypothetical protein